MGDILHSRVARSNIWSLTAAGADLWLCGPATLLRGFDRWAAAWSGGAIPGHGRFNVTSDVDAALRDADVVMALRIQRERMQGGLLPSLREYAARFGLNAERVALAKPEAIVMHPGPMNEGVEIAPDVAVTAAPSSPSRSRTASRSGWPCSTCWPGRTAATRRGEPMATRSGSRRGRAPAGSVGRLVGDLEISGPGWSTRLAAARARARSSSTEGVLESVVWLEGAEADGVDDRGVVVAPGFFDLHAHFREPGFEDAETIASGSAAAAHGGYTTVALMPNTSPALDEPGVLERVRKRRLRSGSPVEILVYGAVSPGGAGEQLSAMGELADAGVLGFSDDGAPGPTPRLLRSALLYAGMLGLPVVDHAEDPELTAGAEANEGYVASVLGPARAGRPPPRSTPSRGTWPSWPTSCATSRGRGST